MWDNFPRDWDHIDQQPNKKYRCRIWIDGKRVTKTSWSISDIVNWRDDTLARKKN